MLNKYILPLFAIAASFAQPPGMGSAAGQGPGPGMGMGMGMQGPGHGPGAAQSFTEIKAYLNLSDTQLSSINAAIRAAADSVQTLRRAIGEKHAALRTLLNNGSTDASAIGKAMIEIRDLEKQVAAAQAKIQEQALSFLSAEQKSKLKTLEEAEKLRPAIGQAHALRLLAPQASPGPGPGRRSFGAFGE